MYGASVGGGYVALTIYPPSTKYDAQIIISKLSMDQEYVTLPTKIDGQNLYQMNWCLTPADYLHRPAIIVSICRCVYQSYHRGAWTVSSTTLTNPSVHNSTSGKYSIVASSNFGSLHGSDGKAVEWHFLWWLHSHSNIIREDTCCWLGVKVMHGSDMGASQ